MRTFLASVLLALVAPLAGAGPALAHAVVRGPADRHLLPAMAPVGHVGPERDAAVTIVAARARELHVLTEVLPRDDPAGFQVTLASANDPGAEVVRR